ncbi:MAG: hypothetical protein F9K29_04300 [Hyphomicrobiaceae bacterium]|nr:MAG: hypothetical protein F9K29_04300 [Hyphomicrobiaceae bacterium]
MLQSSQAKRAAIIGQAEHPIPVRKWHATGHLVSIYSSLIISIVIGVFFIAMRGWSPADDWQMHTDFIVTWLLLTYIWVQMGCLILVGAGSKNQMWLDAFTSIIPLFLIFYVIVQHYTGYLILSVFQTHASLVTAYTMLLDFVIDLGVSVLLSRQVVDVGSAGVG